MATDASTAESKSRLGYRGYLWIGIITGAAAVLFFPPVFGAVSIICGIQVYRRFNELHGIAIAIWGGIALTIGLLFGLMGPSPI